MTPEERGRCWHLIDWVDRHTGKHLPWGGAYVWKGLIFGMPSGLGGGFWFAFPLPRMLPGFVRETQVDELRTRAGRRETDLCVIVPVFPPGKWLTSRTRRLRPRVVNPKTGTLMGISKDAPLLRWMRDWRQS